MRFDCHSVSALIFTSLTMNWQIVWLFQQTEISDAAKRGYFLFEMHPKVVGVSCELSLFLCRYEPESNELINEELGIAYPIIDGIPNMIPQEARLLQKDSNPSTAPTQE